MINQGGHKAIAGVMLDTLGKFNVEGLFSIGLPVDRICCCLSNNLASSVSSVEVLHGLRSSSCISD